MWSGGREVVEIDEVYLSHCESEHAARARTRQGPVELELDSGVSSAGRHLKRKALLSIIREWTANGVPADLLSG